MTMDGGHTCGRQEGTPTAQRDWATPWYYGREVSQGAHDGLVGAGMWGGDSEPRIYSAGERSVTKSMARATMTRARRGGGGGGSGR